MRIDHLLLNQPAFSRLTSAGVDKYLRAREKPSDHAPTWIVLATEASLAEALGRQEVERVVDDHLVDVLRAEVEGPDACQQLLLDVGHLEFARDDAHVGDPARGRDRQLQDDLALQAGLVAQRTVVDGVDRALVALEHQAHVLDRT